MEETQNKILITEDDPFLVKIMGNRLKEEGFDVDTAGDGQEALDKIKNCKYCLMMLDLIMPNMNGFEVLQKLKDMCSKIPVLVFTNLSQEEDKQEVMSLGAKDYFVKSDISMDDLVGTIRNCVNG